MKLRKQLLLYVKYTGGDDTFYYDPVDLLTAEHVFRVLQQLGPAESISLSVIDADNGQAIKLIHQWARYE